MIVLCWVGLLFGLVFFCVKVGEVGIIYIGGVDMKIYCIKAPKGLKLFLKLLLKRPYIKMEE